MISVPSLNRGDYFGVLLPEPVNVAITNFIANEEQFPYHTNNGSFFNYINNAGGYYNSNATAVWTYTASSYTALLASANVVSNVCWKNTDNSYFIVVGNTANNNVRLLQITNPTSANTATNVGASFATAVTLTALNHLSFDGTNFQLIYNNGTRILKISTAGAVVSDAALPVTAMDVLSTDIYLLGIGAFNTTAAYPVGLRFKKGNNLKSIYPQQWAWRSASYLRSWGDKVILTNITTASNSMNSGAPYAYNKSDFIRFLNEVAITL